ncbi:MAG TPA: phosphoglycerate dehydrogenase [Crocinitomix sp.]|nr:phosphoglycerate dehydrogenase [Crocinitomix sp.]
MKKKIAFIDVVHPILEQELSKHNFICDNLTQIPVSTIEKNIHQYQGLVIRSRFPINAHFLKKATQLEFIARSGAGMENIDVTFCKSNKIALFNAPEGNRNAVAEHALGMLLSLFNHLVKADKEVRNGIWDREGNRGVELDGKTVGIIGFGNNGSAFAKKLRGFDVKVLAYDKYKTNYGDEFVKETTMLDIFEKADVISFHIPQNEETIFFADEQFFNSFKKNIYLINLARGKIVKTTALLNAINKSKVLGACLDVLEFEKTSFENIFTDTKNIPPDFKSLITSNKVIFSPHVGGWTIESYYKLSKVLAHKILKFYDC